MQRNGIWRQATQCGLTMRKRCIMLSENREETIMCRLRGNIAIRLQGIVLIGIAILCHRTNADGAALFIGCLGCIMIIAKITKEDM